MKSYVDTANTSLKSYVDTTYSNASNITSGTLNASRLPTSGVTAGTYGGANSIPVITVGTDGRISGISTSNLYADANSVILKTNTVLTSNTTIASNTGGLTVGPLIVSNSVVLTVAANARYLVV